MKDKEFHQRLNELKELWLNAFNLKSIEQDYIPNIPKEVKDYIGNKDMRITQGSFLKLLLKNRESMIGYIKPTIENPNLVLDDGNLILGKHLYGNDFFVNVSVEKEEYFISISNGIKELNNIKNKIANGAKIIYQSPNANSILQTLLQASRYSTNKIDSTNSTTIPNASQSKIRKCR